MRVAVVGSGPSGIAAASELVKHGIHVDILDVGNEPPPESQQLAKQIREAVVAGEQIDRQLLRQLKHGAESVGASQSWLTGFKTLLGGMKADKVHKRILGSKFVFSEIERGIPIADTMVPRSLAKGGLSNVWGAACYSLRPSEYADWPIDEQDLAPFLAQAVDLLGVNQQDDPLRKAYPIYGEIAEKAPRNPGSAAERAIRHWRSQDLRQHGIAGGRARLAVQFEGDEEHDCRKCGLCFYGCAVGSIYNSKRTLADLQGTSGLKYSPRMLVLDFQESNSSVRVRMRSLDSEQVETREYDALFLAAGPLSSLRIVADSLNLHDRPTTLLDNDMFLLPMRLRCARVPGSFRTSFALGEAVLAIDPGVVAAQGVHLQFYSFHEYFLAELAEPLAAMPRFVQWLAWSLLNSFMLGFVYLAGKQSVVATASVKRTRDIGQLRIEQSPNEESQAVIKSTLSLLRSARKPLGMVPISAGMKKTPLGFSGHLAGTLPMSESPCDLGTFPSGGLANAKRVYVVDSSVLPALPSQNLTYLVVANALRVANRFAMERVHSTATL